jgi:hypothetical protein
MKEEARRLVEVPEDVTWDDLMNQIVRQAVEAGLADSEADRVIEVEEVRRHSGRIVKLV